MNEKMCSPPTKLKKNVEIYVVKKLIESNNFNSEKNA